MITADMYRNYLASDGNTLSQVKRNESDYVINQTFTADVAYKKVYILTQNGWKFEDAKYQFHTTPSILKDAVDYYLQFRPKIHYPIGSYVFIPDDNDFDINLSGSELDDPFAVPEERITQLWLIVGRDDALSYVRYNVLKCNWKFKWIYNDKLCTCWGANRYSSSYTSGKWTDEYSSSLDNLTSAWLPDTYYTYQNFIYELGLSDTRTIMHDQRFMLTNNILDPKVYQVTKVLDLSPSGIIKLSIKQDELDLRRDNVELKICDYYTDSGDQKVTSQQFPQSENKGVEIKWMTINEDGELEEMQDESMKYLHLGKNAYFKYSSTSEIENFEWSIKVVDGEHAEKEQEYYTRLMKITVMDNKTISIKPSKANSLIGKRFTLSVHVNHGISHTSIEMEVVE